MNKSRVWIRERKRKNGKAVYDLRWIDPNGSGWKSQSVGGDRKRAEYQAALLEQRLGEGPSPTTKRVTWQQFTDDHVSKVVGAHNAVEARYCLEDFGKLCNPTGPHAVTFSMIERFNAHLIRKGNMLSTRNRRLHCLQRALELAVKRELATKNPMDKWPYEPEDEPEPRIVTEDEEARLLKAAKTRYGYQWWAFLYIAPRVGGRRDELRGLRWTAVDLDDATVRFKRTKGKRDRIVPVNPDVVDVLRKLQAMTLKDGGPFVGLRKGFQYRWNRIRELSGVTDVTLHAWRRSYVTRLLRAGVPLEVVAKLAGHKRIETTVRHYAWIGDADLRAGVAKLRNASAG